MRFRKSKKIAPGVRLNLSAKSASISIGPKGFKKTFSTSGRVTTTSRSAKTSWIEIERDPAGIWRPEQVSGDVDQF